MYFVRNTCNNEYGYHSGREFGVRKSWIFITTIILCLIDSIRIAKHMIRTFKFVAEMKERFDLKIAEARRKKDEAESSSSEESVASSVKWDKRYKRLDDKNSKFITRSASYSALPAP
jgi:hypothetical protein